MGSPQWPKSRASIPQGRKVEPTVHEICPGAVGQIGTSLGNKVMNQGKPLPRGGISYDLYKGRGFEAPHDVAVSHHKSGSQGEH